MSFIQCISLTAAVTTVIHFTRLFLSCFRDDNPEMTGNTEYTNFLALVLTYPKKK